MDDCNVTDPPIPRVTVVGSDSSMDDCNARPMATFSSISLVQIPLWTIVTARIYAEMELYLGSDSSMDDCNKKEESKHNAVIPVQIPLWTIVT